MARVAPLRRRAKVSVSVDPELLEVVDAFVDRYPDLDRSKIFDEALYLWYVQLQAEARLDRLDV